MLNDANKAIRHARRVALFLPVMRLDDWLVQNGYYPSRQQARQAIVAGQVRINGMPARKPAQPMVADSPVHVDAPPLRYVSRGGDKLEAALSRLPLVLAGKVVLDVGASTGGFTDCALQHGAAQVFAVDVGTGQLHERLRGNKRVTVMEQTDIRTLPPLPQPVDVVLADLSFISLTRVLPHLLAPLRRGGQLLLLIKPQFEQERRIPAKGGIIKNPLLQQQAVDRVLAAARQLGLTDKGVVPVGGGPKRNTEFAALFYYEKL